MNNIYVYSPSKIVTGGPTWIQQIVYELNKYPNNNAFVYYNTTLTDPQAEVYTQKYHNPYSTTKESFEDGDIIIFPEVYAKEWYKDKYKNCIKFILWASVNYYLSSTPPERLNDFPNNTYHIVQGNYAKQYLKFAQIPPEHQISMIDTIEDEFLIRKNINTSSPRENIILYNPKKGKEFTDKIISSLMGKYIFTPLTGYTTAQLINLMTHSKLYIDFGYHPGKDRIPREASACRCCLITSTLGSAKYFIDMPIPDKYKFDTKEENIPAIGKTIEDIMENYEVRINDFQKHRDMVFSEKAGFRKGIDDLVNFIETLKAREG